jgi:carboxyl-terminal processing protease
MSIKALQAAVFGLLAVAIAVLVFAVGYVVGDRGEGAPAGSGGSGDAAAGQDGGGQPNDTDFGNLNDIFQILQEKYVDPDLIDRQTQYQQAINGMLETLPDSGTFYVDPQTVATSVGPSGKFEGIGATVASQNGEIVIVAPIEDTPAQRAGLLPGDVILEVDGASTEGWTQEKAVLKIRGPAGTKVTLKVRHADSGEEETLEIERDEIKVKSVTTQPPGGSLKDGSGAEITDIAYIYLREFTEPSREEMQQALQEAVDSGKKGLILDLRNNPGGLLRTTIDIADEFLEGDKVILTERDRGGTEQAYKSKDGGIAIDIPVVILMNRFSASGSEVLAAALQDNGRAQLVGEKSFGKGTVNVSNDLDDGGQLYVSVAKWLTPNGTQIDGVGIRPDVSIQLNDEDIDLRRDVQLWKAIDVLRGTDFTPPRTPVPATATPAASPTSEGG